jgi:hypothetical protein
MNSSTRKKRVATAEDVVKLARKTPWRAIKLSSGAIVSAETTRQVFEDAARALASKPSRKRAHAVAA